jgi:hypothetical protein
VQRKGFRKEREKRNPRRTSDRALDLAAREWS